MNYQFDSNKLKECIEQAKSIGTFNGVPVSSKMDIREIIATVLGCETDTIRKWERKGGTHPRDVTWIIKLEEMFGTSFRKELEREEKKMEHKYSESVKESIKKAYCVLKTIIREEQWDNEYDFCKLLEVIDNEKISMPAEIYDAIVEFVSNKLSPLVYRQEEVFKELHTDKFGAFDESGAFVIKDSELVGFLAKYYEIIMGIDEELDEFAKKTFQPILLS